MMFQSKQPLVLMMPTGTFCSCGAETGKEVEGSLKVTGEGGSLRSLKFLDGSQNFRGSGYWSTLGRVRADLPRAHTAGTQQSSGKHWDTRVLLGQSNLSCS